MPFDSTANLLFTIAANTDDASENIQRFRTLLSKDLSGIADEFKNWSNRTFGDLTTVAGALTGVTAALAAGAVALGAALFEAAEHAAQYGAQIFEASERTGLSAESLSGLMAITKITGENFDSLSMSLGRAGRNLEMAIQNPAGQAGAVLTRVMGSTQALTDLGLKPMDERLQIVLQRVFALNDTGERNLALQALLGRGWMTNIETLKMLAEEGYGPAIEQAKTLGLYFNQQAAQDAKAFEIAMKSLTASLTAVSREVGSVLIPRIKDAILGFGAWFQLLRESPVSAFAKALGEMALDVEKVATFGLANVEVMRKEIEQRTGFTKILEDQRKLIASLTEEMDKTGGMLPDAGKLQDYTALSDLVMQLTGRIAALGTAENKIAFETIRLTAESDKAAQKLQELHAQGQIGAEAFAREGEALKKVAPLIEELAGLQTMADAEKLANSRLAAVTELQTKLRSYM